MPLFIDYYSKLSLAAKLVVYEEKRVNEEQRKREGKVEKRRGGERS